MKSKRLTYKQKGKYYLNIFYKEKNIGFIYAYNLNKNDNSCEIGYSIIKEFQNKGFATESLKIFIDYLINKLNINKIICECEECNYASRRVMEKSDLKEEGLLISFDSHDLIKHYIYSYFK